MHSRAFLAILAVAILTTQSSPAQQSPSPSESTALTIYNDNFAVARTTVDLNLQPGVNNVTTTQVTTLLEPDSVILRNPPGHANTFHILEQNYDSGVVTQEWLLHKFEGKTIDFEVMRAESLASPTGAPQVIPAQTIKGKIIRAGGPEGQPLIEVNGQMQFQMPGMPIFPAVTDNLLLKPTLRWQIQSEKAQSLQAELAYITGGISWQATYNVVAPEATDVTAEQRVDFLGWVTINNQTGSDFPAARIKLMAGDVAKLQPENRQYVRNRMMMASQAVMVVDDSQVTQKAFDDFHLYDLHRTVQLRDGEIKQVEFLNASGVAITRSYQYDGAAPNRQAIYQGRVNEEQEFGIDASNHSVSILQEIGNTTPNHLGIPLPSGRLRLYRRDSDGQIEFIGESLIPHTPTEGKVKIASGSAFDVKGTRTQTDFHVNRNGHTLDETIQVKLTNQKSEPAAVTVLEHLARGNNWDITDKSADFTKVDSHTIEFPVQVPAKGESTVTYSIRYTW